MVFVLKLKIFEHWSISANGVQRCFWLSFSWQTQSFLNHLNWIRNEENIQFESNGSNAFFLFSQAYAPAFSHWMNSCSYWFSLVSGVQWCFVNLQLTHIVMKISSKELEMKALQLINDRVMFNDKCSYPNGDKTLEPWICSNSYLRQSLIKCILWVLL